MSSTKVRTWIASGIGAAGFLLLSSHDAFAQQAPSPVVPGETQYPTPRSRYMANPGPQFGARVGYAGGVGSVFSGLPVQDASDGALPVIVDIGWRIIPHLYVGAYGQYAPVLLRNNPLSCPDGFDCAAQNWRFGLQADYHFLPRSRFDPYVGFGGGYEVLHTKVTGSTLVPTPQGAVPGSAEVSTIDRGWEFGSLTLGFDYRISRGVGVGPFVTGTLGRYNVREQTRTVTVAGNTQGVPVPDVNHVDHAFLIGGLRGTFNP